MRGRFVGWCGVLLGVASPLWAAPWHLAGDVAIEGQVRENEAAGREAPLNGFGTLTIASPKQSVHFSNYLQYTRDVATNADDFTLYEAALAFPQLGKGVTAGVGRQWMSPAVATYLADGARLGFTPAKGPLGIALFAGIPRFAELGDFSGPSGLIAGNTVQLLRVPRTEVALTTLLRKFDATITDWRENDTLFVNLAATHQLRGAHAPSFFLDSEYDVGGKVWSLASVGTTVPAGRRLLFNAAFTRTNVNRRADQPSILALFSDGAVWQGRGGVRATPNDRVSLYTNYHFQRYTTGARGGVYGHILESGIDASLRKLRCYPSLQYRYVHSYGGRTHDLLLTVREELLKALAFDAMVNISQYSKITNLGGTAYGAGLSAVYTPIAPLSITAGAEWYRNRHFDADWRATFGVRYAFANQKVAP